MSTELITEMAVHLDWLERDEPSSHEERAHVVARVAVLRTELAGSEPGREAAEAIRQADAIAA